MLRRLAASLALAGALAGCSDDTVSIYPITSETPVVHAKSVGGLAIAQGTARAVQSAMIHEEIEGSSALPVTNIRSDDSSVLDVKRTSHFYSVEYSPSPNGYSFVFIGVAPGTAKLRLYDDDDEVGTVLIEVVAQAP